jgi:hypothetical protein
MSTPEGWNTQITLGATEALKILILNPHQLACHCGRPSSFAELSSFVEGDRQVSVGALYPIHLASDAKVFVEVCQREQSVSERTLSIGNLDSEKKDGVEFHARARLCLTPRRSPHWND